MSKANPEPEMLLDPEKLGQLIKKLRRHGHDVDGALLIVCRTEGFEVMSALADGAAGKMPKVLRELAERLELGTIPSAGQLYDDEERTFHA